MSFRVEPPAGPANFEPGEQAWAVYWETPILQSAFAIMLQEVQHRCVVRPGGKPLLETVLRELIVFGYVLFKPRHASRPPQVVHGHCVALCRDKRGVIRPVRAAGHVRTTGWRLVIWREPIFDTGGGLVRLTSQIAAAIPDAHEWHTLRQNAVARDNHNATPSVYTTVMPQLASTPGTGRTWFTQMGSAMINVPPTGGRQDHKKIRAGRDETLANLTESTVKRRAEAAPIVGHAEHKITDGLSMAAVGHMHQEPAWTLARMGVLEQAMHGTIAPMHAAGGSTGTERQAAGSLQTVHVFTRYSRHLRVIVKMVKQVFTTAGVSLDVVETLTPYELMSIQPVLTPEALLAMTARTFGIDPDMLSLANVKQRQQNELGNAAQGSADVVKTEAERTEERDARAAGEV